MSAYVFRGITLSADIQASIDLYVEHGIPTGGFLEACIENDLLKAVSRADEPNLPMIPAIVGYLYNECPAPCWGSKAAFKAWIESKCRTA